jgi:glycosyltransferase involved in cell wall biosynthesis
MAHAFEQQQLAVRYVGPLRYTHPWLVWAKKQFYARLHGQIYLPNHDLAVVRGFARQAARAVARLPVDVVFSPGTLPIAYLDSRRPIVFWTDSTFAGMIDFYPEFTNLCQETLRSGHALEAAALERAALAVYSSEWAAESAKQVYGAGEKVHVVPFGANIEAAPDLPTVRAMIANRSSTVCTLLFLGATWFRKGGDIAVEITRQLNAAGIPSELLVVGRVPPRAGPLPSFVRFGGVMGHSSPLRLGKLQELMAQSHFLLLPTRADCTPVAFSEANAFGVPVVTSRVGGIASIIHDGVNGIALDRTATIADYRDFIAQNFLDQRAYRELALASFHEYETRLNWTVAGRTVRDLMATIL